MEEPPETPEARAQRIAYTSGGRARRRKILARVWEARALMTMLQRSPQSAQGLGVHQEECCKPDGGQGGGRQERVKRTGDERPGADCRRAEPLIVGYDQWVEEDEEEDEGAGSRNDGEEEEWGQPHFVAQQTPGAVAAGDYSDTSCDKEHICGEEACGKPAAEDARATKRAAVVH